MGAQLVGRAFAALARDPVQLSGNARLVLLFMALTALDSAARPVYYREREATALAIGRMVPDEVEPDHPSYAEVNRQRESAFRLVRRATSELVERGYIRRRRRGQKWQRAEYEITIPALALAERIVPPETEQIVPPERNESFRSTEQIVPPKEPQEPQEPERGVTPPRARTSRAPVESRGAA